MEFSSLIFLYLFLPLFLLVALLLKKQAHNLFLLAASVFFYAWGEGGYILVLLVSVAGNYLLGCLIDRIDGPPLKRTFFWFAVAFNVGLLGYFKYTGFILDNLNIQQSGDPVHLPLGISFFTFQALAYIIDVYRKTVPNDTDPVRFGVYMTMFPKLITGPITSYHHLAPQIKDRTITADDFAEGVKRFIIGLGKKVLIANVVARTADAVFAVPADQQTAGLAWLGIISYTLQIYFDFSGYTDMAVGIGRMCGFTLFENFNYPYIAKNIKDFWARWHISLAWWLRDYLFLPVAYAIMRKIKADRLLKIKAENWAYYIGTSITFLLCGLWHGANWTFIVWGGFYGLLLIIEHAGFRKFMKKKFKTFSALQILYTQFMVVVAWVFFRSPDMGYAFGYLKAMFGFGTGDGVRYYPHLYLDTEIILITLIGIIGCFPLFPFLKKRYDALKDKWSRGGDGAKPSLAASFLSVGYGVVYNVYLAALLFASTAYAAAGTYNPFIYFRF